MIEYTELTSHKLVADILTYLCSIDVERAERLTHFVDSLREHGIPSKTIDLLVLTEAGVILQHQHIQLGRRK